MGTNNLIKDRIKHVVVIMIENRGFDSLLGYLYSPGDEPKQNIPALKPGKQKFNGLNFVDTNTLSNALVRDGITILNQPPVPIVRASNSPGWDPGEQYHHVNVQLFGQENPSPGQQPNMKGFIQDYSTQCKGDLEAIKQIMHMYTPVDLPVLNRLAKAYAVSDMWFASVPTHTNANRAFSLCGTSMGLVDNGFLSPSLVQAKLADDRFKTDTIWNVLERNNFHDWAIFWNDTYPPLISCVPYTRRIFPHIEQIPSVDSHFYKMDRFFAMAEAGTLPAFSYIEPSWGGKILGLLSVMGNEYHPPSDVTPGEELLKRIYLSLTKNKAAWEKTLLVITCDEHGGTYDHVPPPWGAQPPWGSGKPGFKRQYHFNFDRFGVRVPTILVSPYIEERTVFRSTTAVPYDHTSVIATILDWQGIDRSTWGLGERVAHAPTFDNVLTRAEPRTDNVFAPKPSPLKGTPLEFGEPFYLRHMNGEYVIGAFSGKLYYFPRLGKERPVRLEFRFGWGEVHSGAIVQIRTQEYLEPISSIEPIFAGIRNFLGAWKDAHDYCYYYSSDDAKDYGQQYWQISKVDGNTGAICYGDKVYIASNFSEFRGQRLTKDKEWISTAHKANDWWVIESPSAMPGANKVVIYEHAK